MYNYIDYASEVDPTEDFFKRTWAEVDLNALKNNVDIIRSRLGENTKLMAVVKADCYGHGSQYCLPEFEKAGCDFYAVSNIEEALDVRKYTDKPILILGFTPSRYASALAENNISQAVFSLDYAKELALTAEKSSVNVKIHIKADTGMQRIGFSCFDGQRINVAANEIKSVCALPHLTAEGIFTHFAESDNKKAVDDFTDHQFECFIQMIRLLDSYGINFKYRHCANSAAIFMHKEKQLDMVRAGIVLYGLYPSADMIGSFGIEPVMTLKSVISMIKTVPKGQTIGYGRTYTAVEDIKIATVPVGYADGYPRSLSNKGYVMIKGKRANIVGNVCMDQMMVDVSKIPDASVDDEVLLFGKSNDGYIPADEIAWLGNTIGYELISNLGKRVPLVFTRNGKTENIIDYYGLQERL